MSQERGAGVVGMSCHPDHADPPVAGTPAMCDPGGGVKSEPMDTDSMQESGNASGLQVIDQEAVWSLCFW